MKAPLDHVARGYDRICVPPDGKPKLVCSYWPECMCGDDCIERKGALRVRALLILCSAATAVIGAGLLYARLR
ncbi:hypothetical protein [Mesorhizobium sp.]|uniref:hypothetical protein n=1 Tax=Mesorhizobium sp. TaxID=1871066 RepID=UPI000FE376C4|nr:hypothetical protein [Mesorhizobium sp.]RWQ12379.1 MAG: hypothetical protein EOR91_01300 [Mesorhizobium sp.]